MRFSRVLSAAMCGMEVIPVQVEADVSNGLPLFHMVGYLGAEVREAEERVRTAIQNACAALPPKRMVINLSPGNVRKRGTSYDLPIALAVLAAAGLLQQECLEQVMAVGELGLDGSVQGIPGVLAIAAKAKECGVELFVLDDGWFGKREDDHSSLGDWYPNLEKLPDGIAGIAKKVAAEGMKFGLWFEPEMVNKDSNLYREHPDWILSTPGRHISHGRNQYILDFSRAEVVDAIYGQMEKILEDAPISYIKWDMNRCMSEVYSHTASAADQGKVMHQYILGVYRLYEKLTGRFPEILFESCASGGSRFDPGLLYYAPQAWTSDDTDAVERCKIQYGTSLVYPVSSMGSHVSAVPNHQVLRNTSLKMRADVAYFGTFGYELNPNSLTEAEREAIKKQTAFMKEHRSLIQYGTFYRLQSPFAGNEMAWMVVSEDKKEAIVGWYRFLEPINIGYRSVRLQGLDPKLPYQISDMEMALYGDELMQAGLIVSDVASGQNPEQYNGENGDFQSRLYLLKAKEE